MEKCRRRTCHFIGLFGLLSVATSIAAEFTKTTKDKVRYDNGGCILPGSPALPLGITAAISLFIAQLTANIKGGCARNPHGISSPNRSIAIVCLILSWISFVFAMLLLMAGCALNQRQRPWLDNECYVVKAGVFSGAGALSFAATVFAMIYYGVLKRSKADHEEFGMHSCVVVVPVATPSSRPALNSLNYPSLSEGEGEGAGAGLGFEPSPLLARTK